MQAQTISFTRIAQMTIVGLFLLTAGVIGTNKAHAQAGDVFAQVIGQVIGNVVVAGVDGVSCAAAASINQAGRHNDYNRFQRSSDYTMCANRAVLNRQIAEQQQRAMQERAYYEAQRNAPRVRTNATSVQDYDVDGRRVRVQENFQETRYGRPTWVR